MNFKPNSHGKTIKCAISFLLIIILSVLVGCESKKPKTKTDSSSKTPSVVSDTDDTSLVDISSDDSLIDEDKSNKYDGEYTVSTDVIISRDDAKEVFYNGNCANLSTPSSGYAEKEATELRNKILNAKNTEENYKITGKKYYISPGGDDTNDGLSEETPFRTPFVLSGLDLKSGDAVLFERDSIFRISSTISTKSGVVYGSYG